MKSGLAFFVFAMRALRDLDIPAPKKVVLQINCDEEVGSEIVARADGRSGEEEQGVLVLEPGTGLTGKLKTARKGVGELHGHGARQGVARGRGFRGGRERDSGTGAADRAHRRLHAIWIAGITVNPGVISGGTRSNVVAAEASVGGRYPRGCG